MLEPFRAVLCGHRIILASGSPRRREILETGLPFMTIEIIPSKAEENLDKNLPKYREKPWLYAEDTAVLKAEAVMKEITEQDNVILIGADTVVTLDKVIYGKPKNDQHAQEMLKRFSGQTQKVYSGVCLFKGMSNVVHCPAFYMHMSIQIVNKRLVIFLQMYIHVHFLIFFF